MSWVRIDDKAMTHPKIVGLSDKAFRLWVWGLAYCQQHLTDGLIPIAALPAGSGRIAVVLVLARLWDAIDAGGWIVHDYTDWNDSKIRVEEKRAQARERMSRVRANFAPRTSPEVLVRLGSSSDPPVSEKEKIAPNSRSKRPIFTGQRLTVFEWQLDDCGRILGEFADDFDLHTWFYALDSMAVNEGLVLPKKDGGDWLQSQLVTEAQRRGLPLRMASSVPAAGKLTTRMAEAVANARREEANDLRRIR